MPTDPIVEEVRKAREKIAAECDYDIHRILQRGYEIMEGWPGRVVTKEDLDRDRGHGKSTP